LSLFLANEHQDELLDWAFQRIDMNGFWPVGARALGVYDEAKGDAIRAVLVTVETYRGVIDAHFASDGSRTWATRNILGGIFGYLFFVRGAHRVQTLVSPENDKTIIMNYKLGFKFEASLDGAMDDGGPGVLMSMSPQSCKWLKGKEADNG